MIKLSFMLSRETMYFLVKGKEIFYSDRIWKDYLRCIPKDEKFIEKIRNSRNKYSPKLIQMFTLSKKQEEEYDNAPDEEALAKIIIFDCQSKGVKLLKKEVIETEIKQISDDTTKENEASKESKAIEGEVKNGP